MDKIMEISLAYVLHVIYFIIHGVFSDLLQGNQCVLAINFFIASLTSLFLRL